MAERLCEFCGEPLGDEPIRRGDKVYCSEACAFESTRSTDCAGRTSSTMTEKQQVEPERS